uniref:hypothetical protein n=1 Tax=Cephaleuros parasiticus TaxID=173370 RepID=UPI001EDF8A79|nr:hypothetical protein MFQ79_pgp101 [Cephaleuros parasiticus]UIB38961.1 hypothetical protein [Cephaleuros parasiticus]
MGLNRWPNHLFTKKILQPVRAMKKKKKKEGNDGHKSNSPLSNLKMGLNGHHSLLFFFFFFLIRFYLLFFPKEKTSERKTGEKQKIRNGKKKISTSGFILFAPKPKVNPKNRRGGGGERRKIYLFVTERKLIDK